MTTEQERHPLLEDAARIAASNLDLARMAEEDEAAASTQKDQYVRAQEAELRFLGETGALEEFRTAAEIMNGSDLGPKGDVVLTVSVPTEPRGGDLSPQHMDVILTWASAIREQDSGFMEEGIPHTHFENRWSRLRGVVGGREGAYTFTVGGITLSDPTDRSALRTEVVAGVRVGMKSEWHGMNSEVYLAERKGEGRRKITLAKTG